MISFAATLLLVVLLFGYQSDGQVTYSCNTNLTCGCSANSTTLTKIVGGEAARSNTWGWAVSLYINGNLQCGGSIIDSTWVLTAAHCIPAKTTSLLVYAGSTTRFSGTQVVSVSVAYVHSSYNTSGFIHDIALLKLSTPLNLAATGVDAVCLPSVSAATLAAGEWPAAGTTVIAVGWGRLVEGASTSSISLQQVTLQTVSYQAPTCAPSMFDWRVSFCAGVVGGGKGACQGDSGGPIMTFNQKWTVVGIVSYAVGCARANYSGVYVRVAYYQTWINSVMNGNSAGIAVATVVGTQSSLASFNIYCKWLLLFSFIISFKKMMP